MTAIAERVTDRAVTRGAPPLVTPSADARLRVLFVHSATLPPLGADTWIHALLMRSLNRREFNVHAACVFGVEGARTPTYQVLSTIPELTLVPVDLGPELFRRSRLGKLKGVVETVPALKSLFELVQYVRKNRIDVLHTSDRPRDAGACAIVAGLTGVKYVVHVHVRYGQWMSPILRRSMAGADALIGVSEFVRASLLDSGYSPRTTHAVLNAIDVSAWDHRTNGRAVRDELGIPEASPVIACIARIFSDKGQKELVQALAIVREEFPAVKLLVVGQDYPTGTHYSEDVKRAARDLGVLENVHFLGQRSDVAAILAASDIYAMASLAEPFGLVYVEAMAMGRPVVALDDGGTKEVVEHERSGLLCARGDTAALARNLTRLIHDRALREKMGAYGRTVVETRFNPERMGREVARVYASL